MIEWVLHTLIEDPRLLTGTLTGLAAAICFANAKLIWAFNPGRELAIGARVFAHFFFGSYLLRRFVAIINSDINVWNWDWAATFVVNVGVFVSSAWLLLTIFRQIDYDRSERIRIRAAAERLIAQQRRMDDAADRLAAE